MPVISYDRLMNTGPGVSVAAGVWAAGDRDVAVRGVLFAGAVGG